MNDDALRSIGELSRLTGLSVKTIRFWSDAGVVPPTDRTPAGYRLYGPDALARLGLVRTLRDLGIDLATVQRVLAREITVPEVAAAHAEALDVQIRTLRLRRSVLRAVAGRGSTPQEMELMHKLAHLSGQERRNLIEEFVESVFGGLDVGPEFPEMMRDAVPDLPDDASPEQIEAWTELAELVQDAEFRAGLRAAAADQARVRTEGGEPDPAAARETAALLQERTARARAAGIEPESAAAGPVADELVAAYAGLAGRSDGPEFRAWLLARLESSHVAEYERYWQLLAVINGQPAPAATAPAVRWLAAALRAHPRSR
ncbi:MerR family transcriptional regulator [Streptomyces sclerotialus]|uniref:helix-turn-helix domain-containing protein n=1 Tax=Streptomyces sclerotialus TaxID=1957 RepID=UPI0004CA2992